MTLEFISERDDLPRDLEPLLEAVAQSCAGAEGLSIPVFASLTVVGDEEIHAINLAERGVDRPTDVLSFPSVSYPVGKTARDCETRIRREYDPHTGACFLGDIVISLPRAKEQAAEYGHSLRREICYLTAHAMFHLMGYDHMRDEEKTVMRVMEEKALYSLAPEEGEAGTMEDDRLYEAAVAMLERSYAPYSDFRVGAAILCDDGRVFTGCNVENASYGATICAERCAAFTAVANGARRFVKIAVVGASAKAWPCGMCRQVLAEFADSDMVVLVGKKGEAYTSHTLGELLPYCVAKKDILE